MKKLKWFKMRGSPAAVDTGLRGCYARVTGREWKVIPPDSRTGTTHTAASTTAAKKAATTALQTCARKYGRASTTLGVFRPMKPETTARRARASVAARRSKHDAFLSNLAEAARHYGVAPPSVSADVSSHWLQLPDGREVNVTANSWSRRPL